MKFKYSVSPNFHTKTNTQAIMNDVILALMFVSIASIVLQYSLYGMQGVIRAVLILLISSITCIVVDIVFWKLMKTKKEKMKGKIEQNVPIITGIILALTLPLGNLDSLAMYYVTFISAIVAELFGKLIYGGFGYNIFNPAGVGRAFAILSFGKYLVIPTIDGLGSASPLAALQQDNALVAIKESIEGYSSLLFGYHNGAIGETMIIVLIIAAIYLIMRGVIDWIIPIISVLSVGFLAIIHALLAGIGLEFALIQMLSGGLVFAAVFMLTDPVTNPLSKQGKFIYAIIFGFFTFVIRAYASLPEGVVFAILIVNMLVPTIDRLCANVTNVDFNKKIMSVFATLAVVSITTILLFYAV